MSADVTELWKPTRLFYMGRRYNGKNLVDVFIREDDLPDGETLNYRAARRCRWTIGAMYQGNLNPKNTLDFSTLEYIENEEIDDVRVIEWSAEDAAARRAKQNESARERVSKEHRQAWLTKLEPLRVQYRRMTIPERRALRQLLIEWLET